MSNGYARADERCARFEANDFRRARDLATWKDRVGRAGLVS
jgi:hypothetical protein